VRACVCVLFVCVRMCVCIRVRERDVFEQNEPSILISLHLYMLQLFIVCYAGSIPDGVIGIFH
jgi:hypothetical protein